MGPHPQRPQIRCLLSAGPGFARMRLSRAYLAAEPLAGSSFGGSPVSGAYRSPRHQRGPVAISRLLLSNPGLTGPPARSISPVDRTDDLQPSLNANNRDLTSYVTGTTLHLENHEVSRIGGCC